MGITNYRVDKIDAHIDDRKFENVDVRNSFSIKGVEKKNEQMAEVSWEFNSDYKSFGRIFITGSLVYFADKLDDNVEKRKAGKSEKIVLTGNALKEVSNFVLRRGIVEAIVIARTLQIPVPMQMPTVRVTKKEDAS
jgi:hypothetical protein